MTTSKYPTLNIEKLKSAKAIVFTDFDGTITLEDSNDHLTDNYGMGVNQRKAIGNEILIGKTSFRDGFKRELNSVGLPFDQCLEILKRDIKVDQDFKSFYEWCEVHDIPIVIVSSGMKPIIYSILTNFFKNENFKYNDDIEIVSNNVKYLDDNKEQWDIQYRDNSSFGHDKSICIKEISKFVSRHHSLNNLENDKNEIKFFYCGDGVSDLSAARETDLLFAKRGQDLIKYCEMEKIAYVQFDSFKDIQNNIDKILFQNSKIDDLNELKNR
ncbi:putative phosphoric monoester hydrolase ASCRUDRAFT_80727 [Ascoidea rubescens DSM 1968]|uniref:Phosphoserine phosphatase n=1 Tax=Ascoidea rubescens DSM 1968 TaxID=1344418 RepID=A0A1D2VJ93_9ASCO|nr:hypothetical protein ASCRUDRAFT_80727 [Ascoidea rubescens DSM 1968]ODV61701.1 hypothetical protein ASCRUDRAFT_80727 [Ascoidea rubescens DSM 1968]